MHLVDQERLLDEALSSVKHAFVQMEASLDKGNVIEAIRYASDMLREMRTSHLSPKSYYELYIVVTEKLQLLESFLIEEHKNGRKITNLYEIVQYNPCIVPRLYLLITVGVYQIKCNLSRMEIMRDLVEMCCGVQHPIRGLFLRNYLLYALRTELIPIVEEPVPQLLDEHPATPTKQPDSDDTSPPTPSSPSSWDSVDFLLFNFAEMNKLWVRMQHQGHTRERERREQERRELRLLVGTNLNRLAQLDSVDVDRYRAKILPLILEQLIECRDVIAQEYLMDVIIQVFPDEYHLATLPIILETCNRLQPGVKPKGIICSLIMRLSHFASEHLTPDGKFPVQEGLSSESKEDATVKPITSAVDLFNMFFQGIASIVSHRIPVDAHHETESPSSPMPTLEVMSANGLPPDEIPPMYGALIHLSAVLRLSDPESNVNACLNATADTMEKVAIQHIPPASTLSRELLNLMHIPMRGLPQQPGSPHSPSELTPIAITGGIKALLKLSGFRRLVSILDAKTTKCALACNLLAGALEQEQQQHHRLPNADASAVDRNVFRLTSVDDAESLFDLISVLIDPDAVNPGDPDEFAEIQTLVAGALHLLGPRPRATDPDLCFNLLCRARDWLNQAGSIVIRFNFPALVFEGLELMKAYHECAPATMDDLDAKIEQTASFVYQCINKLLSSGSPDLALRLLLKAALVFDHVVFNRREAMAYEFVSQALSIYEEWASEARAQIDAMSLITSTLCQIRHAFGDENRTTLLRQCTRAAAHLLRKHDQSRAVAATAHCYWPTRILERDEVKPATMIYLTDKNEKFDALPQCRDYIVDEELAKLRDGKSAMSCLDRATKLAHECMDPTARAQLLVNVLNHAICLKMAGCPEANEEWINQHTETIRSALSELRQSAASDEVSRFFASTLAFLKGPQAWEPPAVSTEGQQPEDVANLFAPVDIQS